MLHITVEVENARYPFPVMAAIHVKHGMKEGESFDSIEFSPFEVSFPKYGVAMAVEDFNCQFYAGKIITSHPEPPLKYLQSIFSSGHAVDLEKLLPAQQIKHDPFKEADINDLVADWNILKLSVTNMKQKVMAGVNSKEWRAPKIWNPMKGLQFEKINRAVLFVIGHLSNCPIVHLSESGR